MREASKNLKILLSRFESLESLSRVGLEMDVGMQETLRRGAILRELLRQPRLAHRNSVDQIVALTAVNQQWLKDVPPKQVRPMIDELSETARRENPDLINQISAGEVKSDEWRDVLGKLADRLRLRFLERHA